MLSELLEQLGVEIRPELLFLALTHSSFAYEKDVDSNERLEFLGDAILGYLVAVEVFRANPRLSEGDLSRLKNSIVSAEALATAASRLQLGRYLNLGKGEDSSGGRSKLNILADAMEALIAATYLSCGLDATKALVEKHIFPLLSDAGALREFSDPKTSLSILLRRNGSRIPRFEVTHSGPEHERKYFAKCYCDNEFLGEGEGPTIRSAESAAAAEAIRNLRS